MTALKDAGWLILAGLIIAAVVATRETNLARAAIDAIAPDAATASPS
jgi:hypothetical protein